MIKYIIKLSINQIYAFDDVNPQAPVHVLIIPKLKDNLTGLSQVFYYINIKGIIKKSINFRIFNAQSKLNSKN